MEVRFSINPSILTGSCIAKSFDEPPRAAGILASLAIKAAGTVALSPVPGVASSAIDAFR